MARGSDNRDYVSALLNLSDGMLGDFLSLHIICTINCRVLDIDQALLRPGRLICHRKFERLKAEQADRLAAHLGRSLPLKEDYSLAEVFSGRSRQLYRAQGWVLVVKIWSIEKTSLKRFLKPWDKSSA